MFQIERTVGSSHLSTDGTLRLSAAVDFMQDCCCFQLDNEKELSNYFAENNVTMFLISRQINMIRPAYYGDKLSIRTSIYQLRSTYGYRNTLIYNKNDELIISSYAGGAFIDLTRGGAAIMPKELIKTVPMEPKFEGMEYLSRKVPIPKEPEEKTFAPTPVYHYYIDHNHHVNNARYIDIAQEYMPKGFKVKTCRIEYKTAAKYGDMIRPVRYRPEPGISLIVLQGAEGQIFAKVEFRE